MHLHGQFLNGAIQRIYLPHIHIFDHLLLLYKPYLEGEEDGASWSREYKKNMTVFPKKPIVLQKSFWLARKVKKKHSEMGHYLYCNKNMKKFQIG